MNTSQVEEHSGNTYSSSGIKNGGQQLKRLGVQSQIPPKAVPIALSSLSPGGVMGMFSGVSTLFTCPNGVEIFEVEHAPASLSSRKPAIATPKIPVFPPAVEPSRFLLHTRSPCALSKSHDPKNSRFCSSTAMSPCGKNLHATTES
ncbi:Transposon Tf2-1 polyprotein [Fusarium oxysporum f. sp. albedinis]|nr:Transposon Tf2-1 polyprotein [Fusarium oxysporum f. sp. albedinis]